MKSNRDADDTDSSDTARERKSHEGVAPMSNRQFQVLVGQGCK